MAADLPSKCEQLYLLADSLAGLPKAEAEVLWLYHAENLSFEGIGDRLGMNHKSARNLWKQGLKSLKASLDTPQT
jgi:DNA-directed RNA polymerase specialized sigma24 family protein